MQKRFNLYYLFHEDKARTKMSREKSEQIRKTIESFFHALKHSHPALQTEMGKEEKQEGKS